MKNRLLLGAIFLITAAIYLTLWTAPALTWDDGSNIFQNPFYKMHMWWGVWTDAYYGLYVPIISSVWAFLYWLAAGQVWPFRAFNVLVHLGNGAVLYILLRGLARRWNIAWPLAPAFGVGLFLLHPLQVESVAWISGGRDLLSTFFALAAVAVYFSIFSAGDSQTSRRIKYLTSTILFVMALLSKPNVAVIPLAIVLLDIFLFRRSWRASVARMVPWFGFALVAIYLTELAQIDHFVAQVEWWQRPLVMLHTFGFYLQRIVWPHPLSGNYALTPAQVVGERWLRAVVALLWISAGIALAYRTRRSYLIGILWFVLILPVSGIIPFGFEKISGVADHYAYLPMAVIAAMFMLACDSLAKRSALLLLPLILSGAWAAASYQRTQVWESDESFFTDMAKTSPTSYSTAMGMSVVMCEDVKNYEAGLTWTGVALKAQPDDILALANRAFCLSNAGRIKDVLAMDFYLDRLDTEQLAEQQPTAYASLISSIGTAMIKDEDYMMGFQYLCEAFRVLPSEPNYTTNLQVAADILRKHGIVEPKCDDGGGDPGDADE